MVLGDPASFEPWFLDGLSRSCRDLHVAESVDAAAEALGVHRPDVILLSERVGQVQGLEILRLLREADGDPAVVIVLAEDGIDRGTEALDAGAVDFLVAPLDLEQTTATLALIARGRDLQHENARLRRRLNDLRTGEALVGCSPATRRLSGVLARVAESSATVLIEGRPGSGKTLAAQIIHTSSRRSEKRQVVEYGESLTVARFDEALGQAQGGTLIIEDVERLTSEVQSRVVRHIKERPARPGSSGEIDARIIATTSAHLPELVARGRFREDLYYRLSVFPISVPSLQERRDDVTLLASHLLAEAAMASGKTACGFTAAAMILLETHPWPGNVAQLQDAVTRAFALANGAPIDRQHLLGPTIGLTIEPATAVVTRARVDVEDSEVAEEEILPLEAEERRLLARALKATKGNVRRAAQLLRIGRATLYRKIQVYKLKLN
jgi:DNA-binding NtrC family response regulator